MLKPEYDFLRDHERLGKRIILMGLGGSYAYGTNNDNSDIDFRGITLRAAKSFGGYASAQLRRLQNAIARDSMPQQEREIHILNSVRNAMEDFQRRSEVFKRGTMRIYIDDAENPEMEKEIFIDANYKHLHLGITKGFLEA